MGTNTAVQGRDAQVTRVSGWERAYRWARFNVQIILLALVVLVFLIVVPLSGSPARPVGVVCVVDVSGSVAHQLPAFRQAANWIVKLLQDRDLFALIEVGRDAHIVDCSRADRENRARVYQHLAALSTRPGQGTDLDMALKLANQAVTYLSANAGGYSPLLVMFTDGYDDLHVFTPDWHAPPIIRHALVYVIGNEAYGHNSLVGALQRVGCRYTAYPTGAEQLALRDIRAQIEHMRGGPGWGRAIGVGAFAALFALLVFSLVAWAATLIWPLPGTVIDGYGADGLTYRLAARHRLLDWLFPRGWVVLATPDWQGRADIQLTPNPAALDGAGSGAAAIVRRTWRRYERVVEAIEGSVEVDGFHVRTGTGLPINAPAPDEARFLMNAAVVTVDMGPSQAVVMPQ